MIFRDNRFFLIPYLIFLIIGGIFLLNYSKTDIHLFVNQYHDFFSDAFFKYATYISEGAVVGVIIIALAFYKIRNGLLLLSSYLFSALMAQFFKRMIFNESPRPRAFFEGIADLRFVEGVTVHSSYSFPSGHATAAFALFFSLAILAKKNGFKLIYFFAAILVAWSRVHISQHFLEDIYFGSILGIICTIIAFLFFNRKFPEGLLIDLPLKKVIKKSRNKNAV